MTTNPFLAFSQGLQKSIGNIQAQLPQKSSYNNPYHGQNQSAQSPAPSRDYYHGQASQQTDYGSGSRDYYHGQTSQQSQPSAPKSYSSGSNSGGSSYNSNSSVGGGGSSSGGSSGGSAPRAAVATPVIAPTPVTPTPPPPPPPPVMQDIPDPKADATYKAQMADLARQLADYQASQGLASSQYQGSYGQGLHKLGYENGAFNPNDLNDSYGQAVDNNANDFASRGMLHSGLYGQSVGNINTDFNQRKTDLDTGLKNFGDTQQQAFQGYQSQNQATGQNALRDAVSRIAAQYGVNLNQVTPGKVNSVPKVGG